MFLCSLRVFALLLFVVCVFKDKWGNEVKMVGFCQSTRSYLVHPLLDIFNYHYLNWILGLYTLLPGKNEV